MHYRLVKRAFDLIFATALIFLLSPLLLLVTVFVYFHLGPPVLYVQSRPGFKGRLFPLYKFRSMTEAHNSSGTLLPDSDRLTLFGRFLRSTSLDELPSLFNIIAGDLSFVGPRPLLAEYLPLYTPHQNRRHQVTPGLTGLAQVNGRNTLSWDSKFSFDVWYVDHLSFWLDLRILLLTMWKVISREGISAAGEATTAPFNPTAAGK